MTMFRLFFIIFIHFSFSFAVFSQDRIFLLNGKEISGVITDTTSEFIFYKKSKEQSKSIKLETERVFSFIKEDSGMEYIVYAPDTSDPDYFSVHEMRMFVFGEKEAAIHYKAPYTFAGAVATGFVSAALPFMPLVLSPILPGIYTTIIGTQFIRINKKHIANKYYLSEETYIYGYEKMAKVKRVQRALLGSLIGIGAGYSTRYFFNQDK